MFRLVFGGKKETFKALSVHAPGSKREQYSNFTLKTLGSGDITGAVKLPAGEDFHEWIAANTVDFYNELNLIWGIICDIGVPPVEAGAGFPPGFQYFRHTSTPTASSMFRATASTSCSGPEYVEYVMNFVDKEINNHNLFPTNSSTPFPKTFMQSIKVIFTRMFRIFAIVYHHHYEALHELGAVSHLNTSFKHFIFFIWEYDLVSDAEQEALQDIIKEIRARYAAAFPNRVRTVSGSSTGGAISEGEASSGK
mmetsp:Transcript_108537/g.212682  ORF Transcript_108537/g.212682 Transcript_108537/m.212682 type:complete len:252 (-) Transcript_108537:127-882(-)|eukprot:CAMPEP_0170384130 /NCGR_PEP_ID=MMETSP0117_2-20130122/15837_1 /TAXON_ID=400756 /ORGANISM="Durinskia baltica, Strain CSIRO CS-38" /LENGTH=251 /DNA_ID=CAMNT_0010639865 /DNA_START=116 /DNA_END=871 /DNA_ORIENTATION=-